MNEQLQGKLVEILSGIQAATKAAGDFAIEQLPDIAQQYVTYGRAYTSALAVLGLAVFCCGFLAMHWVHRKVKAADEQFASDLAAYLKEPSSVSYSRPFRERYFEASDAMPLQYVPFIFGLVFFTLNLSQLLLVWFAPKVWLLKEIASLIK